MREFTDKKLVIASHNKGKIAEIKELFEPYGVEIVVRDDLPEPEENGSTFEENAAIKSDFFAKETGLPSLADDTGLVIPALGGEPGIHSARWAGENKDFTAAMDKIAEEIRKESYANGSPAHFVCVFSLTWPDGHKEQFRGEVHGYLTFPPRGERGFGYDPIFEPEGYGMTFGEMEPDAKHAISHRAEAFKLMIESCFPKKENDKSPSR